MPANEFEMFQERQRSNWVRLRTLIILRWFAVAGQGIATATAAFGFGLQFPLGACVTVIGASVVANLFTTALYPGNRRLSEREAALMLAFDIVQLGLLLSFAGGLHNPFALLLLAPVTIAATVLHLRSTVLLGVLAILIISGLLAWAGPLIQPNGTPLALPDLFLFGFWIALVTGVIFLSIYARRVTTEKHLMGEALLATQLALAREQKLTDLGGVVAAAAHELGTPLATIKLTATELIADLADRPDQRQDVELIRNQADRCRDILLSMGRVGKQDLQVRQAPVEAVVREAAEPHLHRGKSVVLDVGPEDGGGDRQPTILRRPEIVHGLRNLIQNAVDFAAATVEISVTWTDGTVSVRIEDDGPGFPASVIGRIGDPFVRRWRAPEHRTRRPGYQGMGLGLFIAKTLLERSGARLSFANGDDDPGGDGSDRRGAIVVVEWPRDTVEADPADGLGVNLPIAV